MSIFDHLSKYLLLMGIPGLLAITFIDSAALPLAGGPDAVILLLSWQKPSLFLVVALTATIGSTLGCLVLYGIGRKSGAKALDRFSSRKKEWIESRMKEYGIWLIIASVIAPPPFPTKLGILAAGVLQISKLQFLIGVFTGRFLRYAALAYLGAEFGDEAQQLIKAHYPSISLILVGAVLLLILIRCLLNRRKTANV